MLYKSSLLSALVFVEGLVAADSGALLAKREFACPNPSATLCPLNSNANSGSSGGGSSGGGSVSGFDYNNYLTQLNSYQNAAIINGGNSIAAAAGARMKLIKRLTERDVTPICCAPGWQCRLLNADGTPLCFNEATQIFEFGDGSRGNNTSGEFQDANGDHYNLYTGDYTLANGTKGNTFDDQGKPRPTVTVGPAASATGGSGSGSASKKNAASGLGLSLQGIGFSVLCSVVGVAIMMA